MRDPRYEAARDRCGAAAERAHHRPRLNSVAEVMAPLAPTLLSHVTDTAGRPINFMINTHVHGDHVGGNENLGEAGALLETLGQILDPLLVLGLEAAGLHAPVQPLAQARVREAASAAS